MTKTIKMIMTTTMTGLAEAGASTLENSLSKTRWIFQETDAEFGSLKSPFLKAGSGISLFVSFDEPSSISFDTQDLEANTRSWSIDTPTKNPSLRCHPQGDRRAVLTSSQPGRNL